MDEVKAKAYEVTNKLLMKAAMSAKSRPKLSEGYEWTLSNDDALALAMARQLLED